VILSFSILSSYQTNHFVLFFYCQNQIVFSISLPVSCLSLFTFHSTLHPSWLPSASLLRLPVFVLCVASVSLWTYSWVGLKERVCVSLSHTQSLSTIPGHSLHARVSQLFPGSRPSKRQGTLSFSLFTSPLFPVVVETINPTAHSVLEQWWSPIPL
jgi:hypothetical protein